MLLLYSRTEYSVKSRGQASNQRIWSTRTPKEKSHRQTNSTIKRPDLKRIIQCKK